MAAEQDPVRLLLLKLRARDVVGAAEERALRDAVADIADVPAGRTLVRSGVTLSHSTLVVEGMLSRYKDLSEGQRQIQEIHLPGDFTDLHGFVLKRLDHNIGALTDVKIATVPHDRLKLITEEQPHLSRLLWFSTLLDSAIQREKIVSVGRRAALARVAHLFCELFVRLELIGLTEDQSFALPITQLDLGDATGLTSVHVNRMLKQLRDRELATFRGGLVRIHDWDGLRQAAEFDPAYLYLERRPR
ncbi:Crp/Fnr family transcriptional regulator [Allosphingosinicella sp.]|jgi:CRP-like cAMP-binding protein|uniref:Crp/Fnr family transcriptional regulator n=1 Tax=Allosphingosinicella sp. TaxID=2823234 RepID=UPI002F1698C9